MSGPAIHFCLVSLKVNSFIGRLDTFHYTSVPVERKSAKKALCTRKWTVPSTFMHTTCYKAEVRFGPTLLLVDIGGIKES